MRPRFYVVFGTPLSGLRNIVFRSIICNAQPIAGRHLCVSQVQSLKEVKGCVAAWSVCETWVLWGSFTGATQQWPYFKKLQLVEVRFLCGHRVSARIPLEFMSNSLHYTFSSY